MPEPSVVYKTRFDSDWDSSIKALLDAADLNILIKNHKKILIKPNLVEAEAPPVTTPVELIEALVSYIKDKSPHCEIIVGDGTGSLDYDTFHVFDVLGYSEMAFRKKITLKDLNCLTSVKLTNPSLKRWPEMYLPGLAMDSFIISVPVLKAHSLAGVTLSMKNMMGLCPPDKYCRGGWKKSAFHSDMQNSIADLNRYRCPDFSIIDATIGLSKYHLGGPVCSPPPGLIVASKDPVAADAYGCTLLKRNWRDIGHISSLDGEVGNAVARVEEVSF